MEKIKNLTLAEWLFYNDLTATDLAKLTGISSQSISMWIRNGAPQAISWAHKLIELSKKEEYKGEISLETLLLGKKSKD